MANPATDQKKPLDKAIERQRLVNDLIKVEANSLKVQKTLNEIGLTVPSPKTKPA